jgi:hypothetical protein
MAFGASTNCEVIMNVVRQVLKVAGRVGIALLMCIFGCASREYSSEPIRITVVDAETKKPIEGALVLARWVAKVDTVLGAPRDSGSVELLETTTGPDGRFEFPAWGPVRYEGRGLLLDEDPLIHVFKRGYWPRHLSNTQYGAPSSRGHLAWKRGAVRASLWSGETIEMKPFKEGLHQFSRTIYDEFVSGNLDHIVVGDTSTPCDWRKLPLTLAYLERERLFYIEHGVPTDSPGTVSLLGSLFANDSQFVARGCGSPRALYKEIAK